MLETQTESSCLYSGNIFLPREKRATDTMHHRQSKLATEKGISDKPKTTSWHAISTLLGGLRFQKNIHSRLSNNHTILHHVRQNQNESFHSHVEHSN